MDDKNSFYKSSASPSDLYVLIIQTKALKYKTNLSNDINW